MGSAKFSRRAFIKTVLASLVAAGCTSAPAGNKSPAPVVSPSARPPLPSLFPSATATPPPSADGVVLAYLSAWQDGNFEAMYGLLTDLSHQRISLGQFLDTYRYVYDQATVQSVQSVQQSLLADGLTASAIYHTRWETILFGEIESDHTMTLAFAGDRWRIDWSPTLILPQLGYGITLAMLEETLPRGNIFDALDQLWASYEQVITVGAIPGQVKDRARIATELSRITGLSEDKITESIASARADWFVPLADIDFETSVKYLDVLSSLAGVDRRPHPVRTYPQGETAAHLIGTMGGIRAEQLASYRLQGYRGDELIGLSGIEAWGEPFLAGRRGGRLVTLSPVGKIEAEVAKAAARPGGHIYLSLETQLQQEAERLLGTQRGAIVVMEPTGFIKAMASYPRFSPALFATGIDAQTWTALLENADRPLVNRAAQGTYPPASIFKIISMSAALEKLGWLPDKLFNCTGHWDGLGAEFPKKCWLETGHGDITLKDGLTQSCDVVFYEVGLALHKADPAFLPDMARAFGFGAAAEVLGLDEAAGVVPDEAWKQAALGAPFFEGDAVNMAIGQGYMLATPLQVARLLAALSTNGKIHRPQIVRRLSSRDSGDQFFTPEETGQLPISAQTLALLQDALFEVVQGKRGTAREAFGGIEYTVVGKTGTAETGIDKPHAWFAGYTPADTPAVVIAVLLENAGEGSDLAAPLFRQMAEAYFNWAKIEFGSPAGTD